MRVLAKALGVLAVVAMVFGMGDVQAAPSAEASAQHLLRNAQSWSSTVKANGLASETARTRHQDLIRDLADLVSRAEQGHVRISHQSLRRIQLQLDALEQVAIPVGRAQAKAVAANGTVTGTISDPLTGPLTAANLVQIQAWNFVTQTSPISVNNTNTGAFTLSLPPGKYHLRANVLSPNANSYINQAYGFGNCIDGFFCPRYVGTIIDVPDGGTVSGINITMAKGAKISGNVKRASDNATGTGFGVNIALPDGFVIGSGSSDASGNYTTTQAFPPGTYRAFASFNPTLNVAGEVYASSGNVPCSANWDCNYLAASVGSDIVIAGTTNVTGIDFALDARTMMSGTLRDAIGNPITDPNALIQLISEDKLTLAEMAPDGAGNFVFDDIRQGNYRLTATAPGFVGAVWLTPTTTRECNQYFTCDPIDIGGVITVGGPGSTISGLDIRLAAGASITGVVRDAATSSPISGMNVDVLDANRESMGVATTNASGVYTVSGLPAGTYTALAQNAGMNYVPTFHGGMQCNTFICYSESVEGTKVQVPALSTISNIDINMAVGATITGVITDASVGSVAPANRTRIELFDSNGRLAVQNGQSGSGTYSSVGLVPGAYKAVFASSSVVGWIDTSFGGLPCPRGGCDQSILPTVFATSGAVTSGINVSLPRGAIVRGRFSDAGTGRAIIPDTFFGSPTVAFYNNLDRYSGFGQVFGDGTFISRTGLPNNAYFVSSFLTRGTLEQGSGIDGNYIDLAYTNTPCPGLSCTLAATTPISVAGGDVSGVNMSFSQGGGIQGTITNAVGGAPIKGVRVRAFNTSGRAVATALTNLLGRYRFEGLPTGSYHVQTDNKLGFLDELFNNIACEPFCNPVSGTAVSVTAPAVTGNINIDLNEAAVISGTVTNAVATPQANVPVEVYGQIGNLIGTVNTNAAGQYRFANLAAGRFYLRTRNTTGQTDDLYWQAGNPNNTSATDPDCVGQACQVRRGTPIDLLAGGSFTTANLSLAAPGVIQGSVINTTGSVPMSGVQVHLYDARGAQVANVGTAANGSYQFGSLAAGNYFAVTRGTPGFVDEAFNNIACSASCDGLSSTPIVVSTGGTTASINFSLSNGASISGSVQNSGATPLVGVTVQVYDNNAVPFAQVATNPSGNYEVTNIPDGTFYVRTQNNQAYIDELFNNRVCNGYCDIVNGDAITISGGTPVGSVNFALANGGSISGQVTRVSGGSPIALVEVQAFTTSGFLAGRATTNAGGNYSITGLPSGNYKVRTSNSGGFVNQVHRMPSTLSCSPTPCLLSGGSTVSVSGATSGINFALASGGTISGTATDLFNNPLPTGNAVLLDSNGIEILSNAIENGLFEFSGIANGSYYVLIENNSGLIDLLYPNVPCPAGSCNITALGTPIVLNPTRSPSAGNQVNSVANIDLRLPTGRQISGRVRRSASLAPLADATVYIFNSSGNLVGEGLSDGVGEYLSIGGFVPGTYYAKTSDGVSNGVGGGLINELFDNKTCMLNCSVSAGDPIVIASAGSAPIPNINFDLAQGSSVSGTVNLSGGGALSLVTVQLFDSAGVLVGTLQTDSLGEYQISGLLPGTYYARTVNTQGLQDVLFGGAVCAGACNPLSGTPIIVNAAGADTPNINFTLGLPNLLFSNGFE